MTKPHTQPAALLDAVCCIQFAAARKATLLLAILIKLNWEFIVPGEVHREVLEKRRTYPQLEVGWRRLTASDRVTVLDAIPDATHPDRMTAEQRRVLAKVAELRGREVANAMQSRKHLGEAVVVGWGLELQQHRQVYVLVDDADAQDMAADAGLDVVDMETLLEAGHKAQLPELQTRAKVREVYEQLRPYGGSLVPWNASRLKRDLRSEPGS